MWINDSLIISYCALDTYKKLITGFYKKIIFERLRIFEFLGSPKLLDSVRIKFIILNMVEQDP